MRLEETGALWIVDLESWVEPQQASWAVGSLPPVFVPLWSIDGPIFLL